MRYILNSSLQRGLISGLALSSMFVLATSVHAEEPRQCPDLGQMQLTQQALHEGFTCSTFAENFVVANHIGPLDVAFISKTPETLSVLATEHSTGRVLVFPTDRDGQDAKSTPGVVAGPMYGGGNAAGVVKLTPLAPPPGPVPTERFYMTQQTDGTVVEINPTDGTILRTVAENIDNATGIVGLAGTLEAPFGDRLYVSQAGGTPNVIYDVDAATGATSVLLDQAADGLDISPSTNVLYLAGFYGVKAYDIGTQQLVFDSGPVEGTTSLDAPDGVVLGRTGTLRNNVFVNTTGGRLVRINCTTKEQTVIGTGGSRGDFVRAAPNGCSLFLTQSDRIQHVTPPGGAICPFLNAGLIPVPDECP